MAWGQSRTACAIGMPAWMPNRRAPYEADLDHAALIASPAHHQQLDVPELGVPLPAHLDEEGVEVDVENACGHGL